MSLIGVFTKAGKAGLPVKKTAPFYSAVDEALANLKRPKGTGLEFLTEVLKQPGVKKAEIADRKLEQAFKAKGKITKEEAQQVLADNPPPKLKEKVYDESTAIDEEEIREAVAQEMYGRPYDEIYKTSEMRRILDEVYKRMDENLGTTHGKWKTPDGENYREILLKLPSTRPDANDYTDPVKYDADMKAFNAVGRNDYQSSHWENDPNVLAHMRVQDRVGPNGERILHVEEIQSDWHQTGRLKGYSDPAKRFEVFDPKDGTPIAKFATIDEAKEFATKSGPQYDYGKSEGVPDAPFKKNWHELAMKRLLNYAADNGYDSIAITPGAEQAKRYSLANHVDEISYYPRTNALTGEKSKSVRIDMKSGRPMQFGLTPEGIIDNVSNLEHTNFVGKNISDIVGKEHASNIMGAERGQISGGGLTVGGEGMKGFYDKMLPDYLNNYGKSYGAKVEMDSVPVSTRDPKSTSWGAGMPGDHPFMTSQDLNEPFDGMVELFRRNPETGENDLVGRMLRADSERRIAQELQKLDTVNQIKLHNFPITPEMRESIKQKGLPLYQQVGIPTAGAGAASQMLEPEEEAGLAGGGSVAKLAALAKLKKMREEMTPRAEAVKSLIARDENRYLADVTPNSLTNESIEQEIQRMAARAKASQPEVKEAKGGVVRMTKNRDAMFMELSNKKLKRK
jgi:hypothetical protein